MFVCEAVKTCHVHELITRVLAGWLSAAEVMLKSSALLLVLFIWSNATTGKIFIWILMLESDIKHLQLWKKLVERKHV